MGRLKWMPCFTQKNWQEQVRLLSTKTYGRLIQSNYIFHFLLFVSEKANLFQTGSLREFARFARVQTPNLTHEHVASPFYGRTKRK